jgi:hypothetical protein
MQSISSWRIVGTWILIFAALFISTYLFSIGEPIKAYELVAALLLNLFGIIIPYYKGKHK